jgi:prophage regulatory protein
MSDTAEQVSRRNLIRLPEVERRTGLSATQIYRSIRAGTFPKGIKTGHRTVVWVEDEVDRYVEDLIKQRDGDTA